MGDFRFSGITGKGLRKNECLVIECLMTTSVDRRFVWLAKNL